jgi:hypothetical protein
MAHREEMAEGIGLERFFSHIPGERGGQDLRASASANRNQLQFKEIVIAALLGQEVCDERCHISSTG